MTHDDPHQTIARIRCQLHYVNDQRQVEHRANLAKLRQLVKDADEHRDTSDLSRRAWGGYAAGLRRAIIVLEGRG